VPGADDVTASMNELQGREIISQIIDAAGEFDLVAEIMGDLPDYMTRTLEDLQLANLAFPQLERTTDGGIIPADQFRELSLIAYANHDNAPLASLYLNLLGKSKEDPASPQARDLKAILDFAGVSGEPPEDLNPELLEKLQAALFQTSSRLAVLMCSDLLGIPLRFNLPGSYGKGTWSDRLEHSFQDYQRHPVYGPKINKASELIKDADRL
jgi:4-alpha-glucanotransferase